MPTVNSSISHEEAWHEVLKPSECVRDGGYRVFVRLPSAAHLPLAREETAVREETA